MVLLEDAEWGLWSDREIARQCGVGAPFVGDLRRERDAICNPIADSTRKVTRNGATYEQNTPNIGKKDTASSAPTPTSAAL